MAALRTGAMRARAPKILLGLEAPDEEPVRVGEPEGVEGVAVGEEEVQAYVGAVLSDPVDGFPDAGDRVLGFSEVVLQEDEVPLGVGVT